MKNLMKKRIIKNRFADVEPITSGQFVNPPTELYTAPYSIPDEPLPVLWSDQEDLIVDCFEGTYSTCIVRRINRKVFHEYKIRPFRQWMVLSASNKNHLICSIFFLEVTENIKTTSIPWLKHGDKYIEKDKLKEIKTELRILADYEIKKQPTTVDDLLDCIFDIFKTKPEKCFNNPVILSAS